MDNNISYILIIGPSEIRGGITTVIQSHMKILTEQGIPFKVINTTAYHSGRGGKNWIILFKAIKQIFSLKNSPEGVHVHLSSGSSFYRKLFLIYILRLKFRFIPILLHVHYGLFPEWASTLYHRPWVSRIFNQANSIAVTAPYLKAGIKSIFPEFQEKIYVLPNKLPFSPPEKPPLKKPAPPHKVFYLGYLKNVKRSQFLLEAIEIICKEGLPLEFTLAGPGGDPTLVNRAKQLTQRFLDKVHYRPWISDDEKKKLFAEAHLFIQPSPSESFSIVTYEAMAWGLPVIAVKMGGPAFLLPDEGALWIKPDSTEEIYKALIKVSKGEVALKKMGNINRKRAIELFRFPISEKLLEIYSKVFQKLFISI